MAGGSQGANPSQIAPQGTAGIPPQQAAVGQAALQGYNPQVQMQQLQRPPTPPAIPSQGLPSIQGQTKPMVLEKQAMDTSGVDAAELQSIYEQASRRGMAPPAEWSNPQMQHMQRGAGQLPIGGQVSGAMTSQGRGYADGGDVYGAGFMKYPQQGQPNQPMSFGLLGNTPPVQGYDVPDATGRDPSNNMGFDGSGSDSGVAGRPVDIPQNPLQPSQQGNKPLGLAQFQQPQGLQIAGNPTSQIVQRPQQR